MDMFLNLCKQKQNFTGIYHCILIYNRIFHIGEKQNILFYFKEMPLEGALEIFLGRAAFLLNSTHIQKMAYFGSNNK